MPRYQHPKLVMGHATRDAEFKGTANNRAVAKFAVAVDRGKAKDGTPYGADFFNVDAWTNDTEKPSWVHRSAMKVHKGDLVMVAGRMRIDQREGGGNYLTLTASNVVNISDWVRFKAGKGAVDGEEGFVKDLQDAINGAPAVDEEDGDVPF